MKSDVINKLQLVTIDLEGRIDSFNQTKLISDVELAMNQGKQYIILNMERAKFVSFPVIKFFSKTASLLQDSGGSLVLFGTSEKLKRQISIYASLKNMKFYRSQVEFDQRFKLMNNLNNKKSSLLENHPN